MEQAEGRLKQLAKEETALINEVNEPEDQVVTHEAACSNYKVYTKDEKTLLQQGAMMCNADLSTPEGLERMGFDREQKISTQGFWPDTTCTGCDECPGKLAHCRICLTHMLVICR